MSATKPKAVIKKIAAEDLRIHPYAQRRMVEGNLARLKQDMDLDAIGVIHAVEYEIDGETAVWVIDGQTRVRALCDLGFGEWLVEVKIHLDVTDDARASALFLKLNNRSPVSPYDKFENELRAGLPEAVGVHQVATEHKIKIARHCAEGVAACISSLKKGYRHDGGASLSRTLDVITGAWGRTPAALEGKIIEGICLFVSRYNGAMELPSLITTLAKFPGGPSRLLGNARGLTDVSKASLVKCVGQVALNRYNQGRRSGKLDPL